MNRRRIVLAGTAGLLLPATGTFAQPPTRKYRIAVLHSVSDAYNAPY